MRGSYIHSYSLKQNLKIIVTFLETYTETYIDMWNVNENDDPIDIMKDYE